MNILFKFFFLLLPSRGEWGKLSRCSCPRIQKPLDSFLWLHVLSSVSCSVPCQSNLKRLEFFRFLSAGQAEFRLLALGGGEEGRLVWWDRCSELQELVCRKDVLRYALFTNKWKKSLPLQTVLSNRNVFLSCRFCNTSYATICITLYIS